MGKGILVRGGLAAGLLVLVLVGASCGEEEGRRSGGGGTGGADVGVLDTGLPAGPGDTGVGPGPGGPDTFPPGADLGAPDTGGGGPDVGAADTGGGAVPDLGAADAGGTEPDVRYPDTVPPPPPSGEVDCHDGLDDDRDGLADCADPDCRDRGRELTFSECTDGLDNDCDGRTDGEDDCSRCPPPGERGPENTNGTCSDGLDNDCNGYLDCDDRSCTRNRPGPEVDVCCPAVPAAGENTVEACSDGIDNDCNGYADCADFGCTRNRPVPEVDVCCPREPVAVESGNLCDDGLDNDCDGRRDCAEADRACFPAAGEEPNHCGPGVSEPENTDAACSDGVDNDRDGYVDCRDRDCLALANTLVCTDLCSPEHPAGACPAPAEVCRAGVCVLPGCSAGHPEGACPAGQVCSAGVCVAEAPPPGPGDLVITEFLANPAGADDGAEYFEVFNPTDHGVDLLGVSVVDLNVNPDTFLVEGHVVVAAGDTFLFGQGNAGRQHLGVAADYVYPARFVLANTSDEIVIRFGDVVVDAVAYDSGAGWPVASGRATTLDPASLNAEANDQAAAWCSSNTPSEAPPNLGTPGAPNEACP